MRLLKHLAKHPGAVAVILALLVVQAICDLSLPNYTSDLVDVGIQQGGIEHAALTDMRASTYEALDLLVDADDRATLEASYELGDDGAYHHVDADGAASLDELDAIEGLPLAMLSFAEGAQAGQGDQAAQGSGADAGAGAGVAGSGSGEASGVDMMLAAASAGMVNDDMVASMKEQLVAGLGDMGEQLVEQRAIAFARTEYEALGIDVGAIQMRYLLVQGAKMLGFTLVMCVTAALIGLVASRTAAKIARDLRERVFSRVMSFSHAEINKFSSASLITRCTNDIQQIQMVSMVLLRMVLYAPILGVGGVIMVSQTNVSMTWIIALAVVVIAGFMLVTLAITMPKFKMMQALIDRVNLVAREILTGVSVVRAFRREGFEQERFEDASERLMRTQLFTNRVMISMMPLLMIVMNGVSVLIVWTAANQIDTGAMQVGDMIAFITYAMIIISSFLMLSMVAIMVPRAAVAAERVDEVLDTQASITDPADPVDMAAVESAAGARAGTVEFDHVFFRYGEAEHNTLHDISFTAEPGKTTAIIGSTGSGKSTLLNLIPRFYDVTGGAVRIDGVDVRDARQADVRSLIGYVPQKGTLFSGTIESNLKFADDALDDEALRTAAQIAQAADFIAEKEDGYSSMIAQGGTNVSGGQKQRLGIARALAAPRKILLFDDSFSALDYKTDMRLRTALAQHAADATVIVVAQRIATVLHADQIVVLDEGRVVGLGTHEELLKTCEAYREIAESQLSASELEGGER